MLELGIDVMALDVTRMSHAGDREVVQCQLVGGQVIPLQAPGQNGPMRIPSVVVNFSLTKEAALQYAEKLREISESLPDEKKVDLTIANTLQGVEHLAEADRKFRG